MGREVRRVPAGFDWPVGEVWGGFLNPFRAAASRCGSCDGTGYGPEARRFQAEWYGRAPFDPASTGSVPFGPDHPAVVALAERNVRHSRDYPRGRELTHADARAVRAEAARLSGYWDRQWSHHLSQADADALVAADRLRDLTHDWSRETGWVPKDPPARPTAAAVNAWSLSGMGHDAINCWVCVSARCEREGVSKTCPACGGEGEVWPCRAAKTLAESYRGIDPPAGDWWQLWSTTTEGHPMTPAFATPEELARHCADAGVSTFGDQTADYGTWLAFVRGPGWAPSMVADGGVVSSGVEAVLEAD